MPLSPCQQALRIADSESHAPYLAGKLQTRGCNAILPTDNLALKQYAAFQTFHAPHHENEAVDNSSSGLLYKPRIVPGSHNLNGRRAEGLTHECKNLAHAIIDITASLPHRSWRKFILTGRQGFFDSGNHLITDGCYSSIISRLSDTSATYTATYVIRFTDCYVCNFTYCFFVFLPNGSPFTHAQAWCSLPLWATLYIACQMRGLGDV